MKFTTDHERHCFETAVEFSCARGLGFNRSVKRFSSLEDAKAYAATFGDKRTMVYAINELGNSAHIFNA